MTINQKLQTAKKSRGWLRFGRKKDGNHRSNEIYVWKKFCAPAVLKKKWFKKVVRAGFENFPKNRSRRCDRFGPKIVKIGAILAIFWPFEVGGANF